MNFKQLTHILTNYETLPSLRYEHLSGAGFEHPLWTLLNESFPPIGDWKKLTGAERNMIETCAATLDTKHIPYIFYIEFLRTFSKGYLKNRSLLALVGSKIRKDKSVPVFLEFLTVMEYMLATYKESIIIINISDHLHEKFPQSFILGANQFMYAVSLIKDALKTHSGREILGYITRANTRDEFLNQLGKAEVSKARTINLAGTTSAEMPKLQRECKIRKGEIIGEVPDTDMDKYFNKDGRINVRGLKLIRGE